MSNFHQNPEKELDQSIMEWLSDHSATIIVFATLATFLLTGYFEFFFYLEVFGTQIPTGFAVAVAAQGSVCKHSGSREIAGTALPGLPGNCSNKIFHF